MHSPETGSGGAGVYLRALSLGVLLALAACTPKLGMLTGPAPDLYTLSAPSASDLAATGDTSPTAGSLLVEDPTAIGPLDSDRIALKPARFELKYFAGARWTDRAPRMLRHLAVAAFENSGRVRSVTDQALGLPTDYGLLLELRDFQAEYAEGRSAPDIHVRLKAVLVRKSPVSIVGTRIFDLRITAADGNMKTVVKTFNTALDRVLVQLIDWVTETAAEPPTPG